MATARRSSRLALIAMAGIAALAAGASAAAPSPSRVLAASCALQQGDAPAGAVRCIACGGPATRTVEHRGRVVGLCSDGCAAAWDERRDELFASMQARGALFDETSIAAQEDGSLFSGWFFAGSYVVLGLIGAAWSAYLALSKGLEPLPWLLRGLALNVVAVAWVAMQPRGALERVPGGMPGGLGKIPATLPPLDCAACGNPNHPSARRCVACGAALAAAGESESARALRSTGERPPAGAADRGPRHDAKDQG